MKKNMLSCKPPLLILSYAKNFFAFFDEFLCDVGCRNACGVGWRGNVEFLY